MRTRHWPLFDLVVRTPRLELRCPDDELALALAVLAARGIHDPNWMPFNVPWTDLPPDELERGALQHFWLNRASWKAEDWQCSMAVLVDDEVVGLQAMSSKQFPLTHEIETGSWLGRADQGKGLGQEMRAAILHLGFAGLGAQRARTSAFHDNQPSLHVTAALGYEPNGDSIEPRRDGADRQLRFLLTRERWEARRRNDIEMEGLEPCLEMFGVKTS